MSTSSPCVWSTRSGQISSRALSVVSISQRANWLHFFTRAQFQAECHAAFPVVKNSTKAHLLSFLKRMAITLYLMPKTIKGKELFRRLFVGSLSPLPPEIHDGMTLYTSPVPGPDNAPVPNITVLFAIARP